MFTCVRPVCKLLHVELVQDRGVLKGDRLPVEDIGSLNTFKINEQLFQSKMPCFGERSSAEFLK